MGITYDTGALVAADRGEHRMWLRHRELLERGEVPTVPAPVLAQGWRGGSRQVLLARLLAGCEVEPLSDAQACAVGELAARTAAADVVDVTVVEGALRRCDLVVGSDPGDLRSIASAAGGALAVERV